MPEKLEVYKCEHCGLMIEVIHAAKPGPSCCGEPMVLLKENTTDAAQEKHVPVIEKVEGGYQVTVGSVAHPMEEKHYIQFIELLADGKAYMQHLEPGQAPEAVFMVDATDVTAREYCNLHGLWKG
ncbi:desulfoferrodoxin [Planctomycetota bacterium]